jgi:hypothetical protein
MDFVNVCYVGKKDGTYYPPITCFDEASAARDWCLQQNALRSTNQIANGEHYYYVTMQVHSGFTSYTFDIKDRYGVTSVTITAKCYAEAHSTLYSRYRDEFELLSCTEDNSPVRC